MWKIIAKLLPPAGFEATYEGLNADVPIGFYPDGQQFAPGSNGVTATAGYSPSLGNSLAVPMGVQMCVWVPMIQADNGEAQANYDWQFGFRTSFVEEAARVQPLGKPFHDREQTGIPDAGSMRFQKPAVWLPSQAIDQIPNDQQPRVVPAGGAATSIQWQGGIWDPALDPTYLAYTPTYTPQTFQTIGDELIVQVTRARSIGDWNFTQPGGFDARFSRLFGSGLGANVARRGLPILLGVHL